MKHVTKQDMLMLTTRLYGTGTTDTQFEGINQRNLKIWADVADEIYFGRT